MHGTFDVSRETTVRLASERDTPRIVEMGKRFHAESIYARLIGFDPEIFARSARALVNDENAILLVLERHGEVIGAICGMIGPHYMTGEPIASELFWWVTPEARGSGLKLLDALEDRAAVRGAVTIGMIAPLGADQLCRVYERKGYAMAETMFVKGL